MTHQHVLPLHGITPIPLAHYLKALGVLRLVATQVDPGARGAWRDDVFHLVTTLCGDELVRFFQQTYAPTPLLSPWNGGSGFYPGDNQAGFGRIRTAVSPRYATYRDAILAAQLALGERDERPAKEEKAALLRSCVASWDLPAYGWLRAAFTLDHEGEPRFPALLGTGGNDGNLDFTNNYMQRLVALIDPDTGLSAPQSGAMLRLALFRNPADVLEDSAVGQFFPGATGGANATSGFKGDGAVNPWDFILMLEGALVLRVASLRRLDSSEPSNAAAPFALKSQGVGYASASPADASSRGEQWMPLWSGASTLGEVSALFDEGRLQGGAGSVRSTVDAARSLAKLGVARGVTEFVRFGYFERNGLSNLAVPVGRLQVHLDPSISLLDELEPFVRNLAKGCGENAPASLFRAQRRLQEALLATAIPGALSATWSELVCLLGDIEHGYLANARNTKAAGLRPLPRLSPAWLGKLGDSLETRLAIAIASQTDAQLGPLRANALPLEKPKYVAFRTTAEGLANDPSVVWTGRGFVGDLAEIALRRVIDGTKSGLGRFPLTGRRYASLDDVRQFLAGAADESHLGRLVRGLLSVDWERVASVEVPRGGEPDALHALVRLAHLPAKVGAIKPVLDARVLRLLVAGRPSDATPYLLGRLAASGLRPKLRILAADADFAMRLAASTAIPISPIDLPRLLARVTKPFVEDRAQRSD